MKVKKTIIVTIIVTIIIFVIYLFLCFGAYFYPVKYEESINNYANLYDVDASLVASVINAESRFNERAISNKGAVGLMQLMPKTAEWICELLNENYDYDLLYNPDFNIKLGTYYLSYLSNKFSDEKQVVCAYNAGEGIVRTWLLNKEETNDDSWILYRETRNYVKKVQKNKLMYSKIFA